MKPFRLFPFLCLLLLTSCTGRRARMRQVLTDLQEKNRNGVVFTSDSTAEVLVNYFDHFWHSNNDRMLAHYLLGRARADMGDAPMAIESYLSAIASADTAATDCDFHILRNVYGQMAEVFHSQYLPEDQIAAQSRYNYYSWRIKDTLAAIMGNQSLVRAYYLRADYDKVLEIASSSRQTLLQLGDRKAAARCLVTASYIHIMRKEYEEAKRDIQIVMSESGISNGDGTFKSGCEAFGSTIGSYYCAINQLDSAEFYFRRVLAAGEREAAYKGLLAIYEKERNSDSIAKYARLYATANDSMLATMNSVMVHKTSALYNYNRHLRMAREQTQRASRIKSILLCSIVLFTLIVLSFWKYYQRIKIKEREETERLAHLNIRLMLVMESYERAKEELKQLQEHSEQSRQAKQAEIEELLRAKRDLEERYVSKTAENRFSEFYRSKLIQRLRNVSLDYPKVYASAYEWEQCIELFKQTFPLFARMAVEKKLEEKDWRLLILSHLGYTASMIAAVMNVDNSTVTNNKRSLNGKLFGDKSASTLLWNLQLAIYS